MRHHLCVVALAVMPMFAPSLCVGQDSGAEQRLRVLVTNDDGYQAPGLRALVDSLLPMADIIVVAPREQQSGAGHGISFRDPIGVTKVENPQGIPWYAVDARPATVVRVALTTLLDSLPDLVVSGINTGDNIGTNAWVSGTVAAAREAAFGGLPALAFSVNLEGPDPYSVSAGWARRIIAILRDEAHLQRSVLLNVNLHGTEPRGIRVTAMSLVIGEQSYERFVAPTGQAYMFNQWFAPEDDTVEGTDLYWYSRGYVTITPLTIDQTDAEALQEIGPLFERR